MPPRGLGAKKERPKNAKGTTLRILKYVMNYRYVVLALLVLTLISNVGNLLGPTFAGKAIGAAVGKGERKLPPPRTAFQGIVSRKIGSVSSKIISVLRGLRKNASVTYKSLFQRAESRSELVATFLAVLELVKARRIRVTGEEENAEIRIITQEGK